MFVVAALSDFLDGYVARSRNSSTTFGKFVDPLADKLLVTCVLIALVEMQRVAAWVAMVIVAREFAVSGLRMIAASSEVIAASPLGEVEDVRADGRDPGADAQHASTMRSTTCWSARPWCSPSRAPRSTSGPRAGHLLGDAAGRP